MHKNSSSVKKKWKWWDRVSICNQIKKNSSININTYVNAITKSTFNSWIFNFRIIHVQSVKTVLLKKSQKQRKYSIWKYLYKLDAIYIAQCKMTTVLNIQNVCISMYCSTLLSANKEHINYLLHEGIYHTLLVQSYSF